ncbi:MAG: serine/threonine-protein kinase [Planctomycetota bacterium]|nr:serine/threonine protein kinase [Planctomycetota bacterium]MCX8040463.1 serine/threonine protein kinase [Planctomycetota bacterium]MDW8373211.1 serine/threonine-protein kinase [Planctomycetota bacterium]
MPALDASRPATPTSDALAPGAELFGYRIEGVLGRGGMGTVYKAIQVSLSRPVALKVLGGRYARHPHLAQDFLSEARASARITHPNLVTVHDVHADPERQLYAYAMELVPGSTLSQLLREQGPLSRQYALHLVYQIAQALSAAHRAGLVHRDVKPDNILVTPQGLAKLLDLGLVRDRLEGQRQRVAGRHLLRIVGTPGWAAPEQSRDPDEASAASDVFGLGCVLYCALTGQPPFVGSTVIDTIVRVCTEEPAYPADFPRDCRQLLALMLAKDPAQRLADGEAVVRALEDLAKGRTPRLEGQAPLRRPLPRLRRR